jgi:hypothetical protein
VALPASDALDCGALGQCRTGRAGIRLPAENITGREEREGRERKVV